MKNKVIDTTYCYIEDATKNPNWGEVYDSSDDETYEDPDSESKRLYEDLFSLCRSLHNERNVPSFQFESVIKRERRYNSRFNIRETTMDLFEERETRYAADFIGVNRKLAHMAGIPDDEIVEYLKRQRTIGGHMLFPVGCKLSINQAKGCNILDRFDFTLAELREYFVYLSENRGGYTPKYSKQLGIAFEECRDWIESFCTSDNGIENFKNFITYWMLDMFVSKDEACTVISLVVSDLEKGKERYIQPENTEPYFPGLKQFPIRVRIPTIKNNLADMSSDEREAVREVFESYIKNTNFVIARRNKMIAEMQ